MSEPVDALDAALDGDVLSADAELRELTLLARRVTESLAGQALSAERRARMLARSVALARRRRLVRSLRSLRGVRGGALAGAAGVTLAALGFALVRARRQRPAVA